LQEFSRVDFYLPPAVIKTSAVSAASEDLQALRLKKKLFLAPSRLFLVSDSLRQSNDRFLAFVVVETRNAITTFY